MANFQKADYDRMAANPAAPRGLQQTATRLAEGEDRFATGQSKLRPWGAPEATMLETARSWYTGANNQGTDNGWDSEFYRVAYNQFDQYQRRAMDAPGGPRPSAFYDWLNPAVNRNATGVSIWGAAHDDPNAGAGPRFGDVYNQGQLVGNVYKDYDQATADVMMGEFMFSADEKAEMFNKADRQALYRERVEQQRKENTDRFLYAPGAESYDRNVKAREAALREEGAAEQTVLAGAATGAATGAGIGAVLTSWLGPGAALGAIVGGAAGTVIGGLGSWLNQDQLIEMRARADEQADIAKRFYGEDQNAFQRTGVWLNNYSEVGMRFLNPFSNLHQGLADARIGKVGDMTAEFYELDKDGNRKVDNLTKYGDIAVSVLDGILQFGSPIGKWMYLGGMGTNVAGSVGQLTTGTVFNDNRGTYDDLEGWQEWFGAVGSTSIDAVQLGIAGAFTRAARSSRAAFTGSADETGVLAARGYLGGDDAAGFISKGLDKRQGERALKKLGREGEELGTSLTINGRRFVRDKDGKVLATRATFEAIAPSEWLRWIPTSYNARRLARIDGGEMSRDHLLASALQLTGRSQFRDAVLMGYAEGGEEFFQAWLDPMATGDRATWGQAWESFLYGAAGGVGMGLGPTNRAASSKQIQEARAFAQFTARTGHEPSPQEWAAMTKGWKPKDFERFAKTNAEENAAMNTMLEVLADLERQDRTYHSTIGQAKLEDIDAAGMKRKYQKAIEQGNHSLVVMGRTSEHLMSPMGTVEKAVYPENAGMLSFREMVTRISLNTEGVTAQLDTARVEAQEAAAKLGAAQKAGDADAVTAAQTLLDDANARAQELQVQQEISGLVDGLIGGLYEKFTQMDDPAQMERAIEGINALLRRAYTGQWRGQDGNLLPPAQQRLVQKAVELKIGRHPFMDRGSFGVLLPQVSVELTKLNAHGAVYIPQGMLKALGADHDGDTVVPQHTMYLSDDDLERFRRGDQYVRQAVTKREPGQEPHELKKTVELVIDPPDSEWAFIHSFHSASANPRSLMGQTVTKRLDDLGQSFMQFSTKHGGPIPHGILEKRIAQFKTAVTNGSVNAREEFVKALYDDSMQGNFAGMRDHVVRGAENTPTVQWIWGRINTTWDMLQKDLAHQRATVGDDVQLSGQREIEETRVRSEIARAETQTLSATLGMFANAPVRSAQFAHYSMLMNSLTAFTGEPMTPEILEQLTTAFRALGARESMSEREKLLNRGGIERRVDLWLTEIAESITGSAMDVNELKLMLANMSVPNVKRLPGTINEYAVDEGSISMLQLLLRRSLDVEESLYDAAPETSDEAKKIRRLKRLTEHDPTVKRSYTASLAVFEVFQDMPLHALIGKASMYISPSMTMGQFGQMLRGLHPRERRQMLARLIERSPAYIKDKDAPKDPPWFFNVLTATKSMISPYAMLMDTMKVVGDTYVVRLEEQGLTVQNSLEVGLASLHKIIDSHRVKHSTRLSAAAQEVADIKVLRDMLQDPDLASQLALLIPDSAAMAVFQLQKDGTVTASKWLEKALVNRNTAEAAAKIYFHTKIASWRQLTGVKYTFDENGDIEQSQDAADTQIREPLDPGKIKSRFHQILYQLSMQPDQTALMQFLKDTSGAKSVGDMFTTINDTPAYRGNQEKLLPWHDDVSLFEPNPNDTWNSALEGAAQRENIRAFGQHLEMRGIVALESQQNYQDNQTILESMHQWATNGVNNGMGGPEAFGLLAKTLDFRRKFPDTTGQVARSQMVELLQFGMAPMQNKGVAPAQAAPLGEPLITLNTFGFSDGLRQELAAMTSEDVDALRINLTKLLEGPVRLMNEDGSTTVFDMSTPEKALEMLRDPLTFDLAWSIIGPTTRDVNAQNIVSHYQDSDSNGNLTLLLQEQGTMKHLFNPTTDRMRELEQAHRYIGMIESYARNQVVGSEDEGRLEMGFFPIQNMIHDFVLAYTHTNDGRRGDYTPSPQQLRDDLIIDVANAIKTVASVDPALRDDLKDTIVKAMMDRVDSGSRAWKKIAGDAFDDALLELEQRTQASKMFKDTRANFRNRLRNAATQDERDQIEAEFNVWMEEWKRIKNMGGYPDSTYANAESVLAMFDITGVDPSADNHSKAAVMLYLAKGERILKFNGKEKIKVNGATVNLQLLYDKVLRQITTDPYNYAGVDLSLQEWQVLASFAAKEYLQETTGRSSSSVPASAQFLGSEGEQIRRYFDHSLSYLVDGMFNPLVLEAADTLAQGNIFFESHTDDQAADILLTGILNSNKLGTWTEVLVDESLKARQLVKNSPVGAAVAQEGDDPKVLADYVAAGKVSFELPGDEFTTTFEMSGNGMEKFAAGQLDVDLVKLQNHFVRAIRIIPDPAGPQVPPEVLAEFARRATYVNETNEITREAGRIDPANPNKPTYRVLDMITLGEQMERLSQLYGLGEWVVQIDYVDIDKAPHAAEWANNIFFDGVGREVVGGSSMGAIASLFFGLQALNKIGQQNPLDMAAKKGAMFKAFRRTPFDTVEHIEKMYAGNLSDMLKAKALHTLDRQYPDRDGFEAVSYMDLPSLHKLERMRHIVVGWEKDSDGNLVKRVFTADEWIGLETKGVAPNLLKRKVVALSDQVAQTLWSNGTTRKGVKGTAGSLGGPGIFNLQDYNTFPILSNEYLERLGLDELGETKPVNETRLAHVSILPKAVAVMDKGKPLSSVRQTIIEAWRGQAQTVTRKRMKDGRPGPNNFDVPRIVNTNLANVIEILRVETQAPRLNKLGIPAQGLVDFAALQSTRSIMKKLKATLQNENAMVWKYVHHLDGRLASGTFGRLDIDNNFAGYDGMGPVFGDIVDVDLSEILRNTGGANGNYTKAAEESRALLKKLSKMGVTVAVHASGGHQDLLTAVTRDLMSGALNYSRVSTSTHFFAPDTGESLLNQAQKALASTLLETDQVAAENIDLMFHSDTMSTSLNESASQVDFEHDRSVRSISHVVLPYQMLGGAGANNKTAMSYNIPQKGTGQGDQMSQVTSQLLGLLNTPEGEKYLLDLLGDDGKYPKYVEHQDANGKIKTIEWGVLPKKDALAQLKRTLEAGKFPLDNGTTIQWGSIIPTVSGDGSIHLARVGFKQPDYKEIRKQANKEGRPDGIVKRITSATDKLDKKQTVPPPFTVTGTNTDHKGFSVTGVYEPGKMAKMVSEGLGLKAGYSWMPKGFRFPDGVIGGGLGKGVGRRVTRIMGSTSVIGKEARDGMTSRMRDAIMVSGINFEDDMIEFLFGVDPNQLSKADYAKHKSLMKQVLKQWAAQPPQYTASDLSRILDMESSLITMEAKFEAMAEDVFKAARQPWPGLGSRGIRAGQQSTANSRIGQIIMVTLMAPGVKYEHVIGTSGVTTVTDQKNFVRRMPALLTQALNDPTHPAMRNEIIGRLNRNMPVGPDGKPEMWFDEQLNFNIRMRQEYKDANGQTQERMETYTGVLQAHTQVAADDNQIRLVHAGITSGGESSIHISDSITEMTGGRESTKVKKKLGKGEHDKTVTSEVMRLPSDLDALYGDHEIEMFDSELPGAFAYQEMFAKVRREAKDYSPFQKHTPMEVRHLENGDNWVRSYTWFNKDKDPAVWEESDLAEQRTISSELLEMMNITDPMAYREVEFMARQLLGIPGPIPGQANFSDKLTPELFRVAVEKMKSNVKDHMHPLEGGRVPLVHDALWRRIHETNMAISDKAARWYPLADGGKVKEYANDSYDSWVKSLFGQMHSSQAKFDPRFRTALDGFMHTYQGASADFLTVPISTDAMVAAKLLDAKTNEPFMSVDTGMDAVLQEPIVLEGVASTYDQLLGRDGAMKWVAAEQTSASELAELNKGFDEWAKNKDLVTPKEMTVKEYAKLGAAYQESQRQSTNAMRNLVNLSVTVRLLNPALYFSAMFEVPFRAALTNASQVLTGSSTGLTGMAAAAAAGRTQQFMTEKFGEKVAGIDLMPVFDSDGIRQFRALNESMGVSNKFLGLVYGELTYQQVAVAGKGKLGEFLERTAGGAARATSDPWWGKKVTGLARRYNEAGYEQLMRTNSIITPAQYAYEMMQDPRWLEKNHPNAHRVALNAAQQARGAKKTGAAQLIMGPIEWMSASSNIALSVPGTLLKIPFLFTRFNGNMMLTLTGMHGFDQMGAMFFDGRTRPQIVNRMRMLAKQDGASINPNDVWNNEEIIEGLDLTKQFVTGAVTHTGLMAAAMLAGGLGLGGEDEEEKKRRRLAEYLNTPFYEDMRDASNDWRWKDAIFLDNVPVLGTFFKNETGHSPVVPHWIMRQFLDPVLGMMRFFETGDITEIRDGFWHAANAMPNSVQRLWTDATATTDLLVQAAADENYSAEAVELKRSLLTNIVLVYEKALLENAFINSLYQARDEFDRNPWAIQQIDDTGRIIREEGSGQPLPTDATQLYLRGGEGTMQQGADQVGVGSATRKGMDALAHQYTEGNATAAVIMSIMPWFSGQQSTYLRSNMVTKKQKVQLDETDEANIEALVYSAYLGRGGQEFLTKEEVIRQLKAQDQAAGIFWDQTEIEARADAIHEQLAVQPLTIFKDGVEVMTQDGVGGVFRSLMDGVITMDSPTIQGFNVSKEMRDKIAEEWTTDLIQEGVDLGLSQESATYRMRRIWFGDTTNPDAPGLREILYSKYIPDKPYAEYDQLNVTYVLGPDGKPWATPFTRQNVIQAIGIPMPHEIAPTIPGVTTLDERGNVVDLVRGINTGLAAVQPRPIAPIEPDDKPMEKSIAKDYSPGGGGRRWRKFPRRGGGYGGGGGGYGPNFQRMMPLPDPAAARMDDVQMINTTNPMIRRSSIRRERITSDRGRLKQWQ